MKQLLARRPELLLAASINVTSMTDLDDKDNKSPVLNPINNSICALPDTISLLARQLLATCWSRIIRKRSDALHDPLS
jgi:hypothetical protein